MSKMCLSFTLTSMQHHVVLTWKTFSSMNVSSQHLDLEVLVEHAESNLKTSLSQIGWFVTCFLLSEKRSIIWGGSRIFKNGAKTSVCSQRTSPGWALTSHLDGGCRWKGENLTLSQTARRTKNTPCHNIPYWKLSYAYPVLVRTDSLFCCVSSYIHKKYVASASRTAPATSRWSRDRGPVINIVGWEATL